MPSKMESIPALPSDENSLSPAAGTDAVFAEVVAGSVNNEAVVAGSEQRIEEDSTILGQWGHEKQAVSRLDPIRDIYDHVKIFFASKSLARAERRFQNIEAKSAAIEAR